jgi:hypothetical protein
MVESKNLAAKDGSAGLNADAVDMSLLPNQWVNMENCRTGSTDAGVTNVVESIGSTLLLSAPLPSVTFYTIGSLHDEQFNRIFYFKFNTTGPWHKITCWFIDDNIEYDVLYSSQVEDGFNWSKDSLIHARIVNNLLYWTDDLNEPKKINVDSALKLNNPSFSTTAEPYTTLPDSYEITVIRRPPTYAPSIAKAVDDDFLNNFVAYASWKFAWQYIYFDGEISVLSMYSTASKLNSVEEEYNYLSVSLSLSEQIPETARIIRLVAIPDNDNSDGIGFAVSTWDKRQDPTPFTDHNSGLVQLSYDYYGDTVGETIDSTTVVTPFHSVPLLTKTIELAKQRLFMGNNLNGYDTPVATSMTVEAIEGTPGATQDVNLNWFTLFIYNPTPATPVVYFGCYLIYIDFASPIGWYYVPATRAQDTGAPPAETVPPASIDYADLIYMGDNITDAVLYWRSQLDAESGYDGFYSYNYYDHGGDIEVSGLEGSLAQSFKSGASYRTGMVFYDKAMRKCGVVTNSGLEILVPNRDYAYTNIVANIQWTLDEIAAEGEIPEWAYYYAPVRTMNQKTRFFLQSASNKPQYFKIDPATGTYSTTTSDTYVDNESVAIGVDLTYLGQSRMGYSYEEGSNDICILYKDSGEIYNLPVIGQDGKWAYLKVKDLGTFASEIYLYEIYTPYYKSDTEPYYEVGQLYPILDPGTDARRYSTITGYFYGDVFYVTRTYAAVDYKFEGMNPNDDYYQLWNTDAGRINLITLLGQVRATNQIKWSETYVEGTLSNGLSAFTALNFNTTPLECGEINKLQLTSKIQAEGNVMLAIHANETASLYLSEVQVVDSAGVNAYFAGSQNIIGTINILKGSFGTQNAESVVEYRGMVFWVDVRNGRVIQYSVNGLFPISSYNATRFWQLFCSQFGSMTMAQVEALGSRPFIFGCVDPRHDEVLFTLPKVLETPPKGYLIDYPSTIYPFDIYDGQAKTVVYNLKENPNYWQGSYAFTPENMVYANNTLYSFKYGHLWQHNQVDSFNNFYGVQYKSRVMPIFNAGGNAIKTYSNAQLQANMVPTLTYLMSEVPFMQVTDLMDYEWIDTEGFYYAQILRNKIQPTAEGYNLDGILTAERMRTYALRMLLEFTVTTTPVQLRLIGLRFDLSKGH